MKQNGTCFGLIGKNIGYSFSPAYFTEKFRREGLDGYRYQNFDLPQISLLPEVVENHRTLAGLNVTIPYKEAVIPYLDSISRTAEKIGAVNTITISKKGRLKGYNTDHYGFRKSLKPLLQSHHKQALILGTGGASKAVAYALRKLGIGYDFVSRSSAADKIAYAELDKDLFNEYHIIINTTPLGTYPETDKCPPLNYSLFTSKHIAFDLIYNPEESLFLAQAKANGAVTCNGYKMLVYQAEKAWAIWNR